MIWMIEDDKDNYGSGYDMPRLGEATPEREREVLRARLVRAISAKSLKDFDLERLKKIWEIVK